MNEIKLRRATQMDIAMVFAWRNDPFIKKLGSSQSSVDWLEHSNWFAETLNSEQRLLFIVEKENEAIGQVRFDRKDKNKCVVSVYLLERFTGQGFGVMAINQGCREVFHCWEVEQIFACIQKDNMASLSAFAKAGFQECHDESCPSEHFAMIFQRSKHI